MFDILKIRKEEQTAEVVGALEYLEDAQCCVSMLAARDEDDGIMYAVNIPAGDDDEPDSFEAGYMAALDDIKGNINKIETARNSV